MWKHLNRGISTPIAITGILFLALLVIGIAFWQYSKIEMEMKSSEIEFPEEEVINNFDQCIAKGHPILESYPRQCETPDGRIFAEEIKPIANQPEIEETGTVINKEFSYPYPLAWTFVQEWRKAEFSLTKISFGKRLVPLWISPWSVDQSGYKSGEEINALTFYFKIKTNWEDIGMCLPTELRLVLNEEGDLIAPINPKFNTECPMGNRTYFDQEVIFVVPKNQRNFTFTTGGKSDIFFEVLVSDNDFKIQLSSITCDNSSDCGVCQECDINKICKNITTEWGSGSYKCPSSGNASGYRCYEGYCKTCGGLLKYDSGAKKIGCWYLASPKLNCDDYCGEKGCVTTVPQSKWTDDFSCSTGKSLTGCSKCSDYYEYPSGWWTPFYDPAKDTCYKNDGGIYYTCSAEPQTDGLQRMCVCNY